MPGWYPDPSGQAGQFRYWDGTAWSQETSSNPGASAPGGVQQFYGQPKGGGPGRWIALVAVVLVVALAATLLIRGLSGRDDAANEDTNSSTPTVSSWDETSTATPPPSQTEPNPSGGSAVACPDGDTSTKQASGGRLSSGGISVAAIGWSSRSLDMPWVHNLVAEYKSITTSWMSVNAVGEMQMKDGFSGPKQAAQMMMECFASSHYYAGFSGRKDVIAEEVTIDGHKGYHLRSEIYVKDQGPDIPGDSVDVIVMDTGNADTMGVYFNSATIGDQATQAEVDKSMATLTVD